MIVAESLIIVLGAEEAQNSINLARELGNDVIAFFD